MCDAKMVILDSIRGIGWPEDREYISLLLDVYGNSEKVLRVIELNGTLMRGHCAYTLAPYIEQIDSRTPEQFIADVKADADSFEAARREYYRRFADATSAPERAEVVRRYADGVLFEAVARS